MGLKGKNVLVTGGLGFFGSHLIERLLTDGAHVFAADLVERLDSYYYKRGLNRYVVFENCDVADYRRIFSVITKNQIDFVFHTAALATVEAAYSDPLGTVVSNVIGTTNILESCRGYEKVKGVLVTSTDKAYGKLPRVDENTPLSGDHPYEVSKTSADLIARAYFKTYKLPVVVTRFGNMYGEGDLNFSRIIPGIMMSLIKNRILKIRSNGKYIRDYIYVKDVVDATIILAKNINKSKGEAYNISSKENMSVIELIKKAQQVLDLKVNYKILSNAKNEIPIQSVDFKKIQEKFNWKPKRNLESTLPGIYQWYKKYTDFPK